jgi:hypothetical protein
MRKKKDLRLITELLPRDIAAGQDAPADREHQDAVRAQWGDCAGRAAPLSMPLLFRSGRLVVYTGSAVWATELRLQQRRILAALAPIGVTRMDIRTTPAPLSPPRPVRHALPVSRSSRHNMSSTADHLGHPPLRAAMQRLARRAARVDKGE